MAEYGEKRKNDIDEVHECLEKTVYAVKQVGINCMRQKSCTEDDINAIKNELVAERKKFEREKTEFEAEKDTYHQVVLADLTSRVCFSCIELQYQVLYVLFIRYVETERKDA